MMARYHSGRRAEYRARDWLRRHGYTVIRSAGSKGLVDLVCWRAPEYDSVLPDVLFVQVKYTRDTGNGWRDANWHTLAQLSRERRVPAGVGVCALLYRYRVSTPTVVWP